MTTEPRPGLTARARILGWILAVVAVAVGLIVVATANAVLSRVHAAAAAELGHETEKFREFASRPNPRTGAAFATVDQLLTAHLRYNLPEHEETFFTIVDGRPDRRSAAEPPLRLDRDEAFVARAAATTAPTSGSMRTAAGPVAYAIIPAAVAGDPAVGQLVIVEFLAPELAEAWSVIWAMTIFAAAALLLVGVTGWFIAGRVLAPIRELRETAESISDTDLDRRIEVVGNDDVAQLAETFNGMLDRLQSAFDAQRRFLDDAGHELRTPITVIRGHLELMGDHPAERAQTLALVGDELGRMSRLVDDLILLARSERPDFLVPRPTELADLVVDTFAKARALAERRWLIDDVPEGRVVVDGQRLTQALLQLAANATRHTGPADTIALGGALRDGRLRLWVRDTGSGVAPEDRERIFERFERGSGETRSGAGRGLGLAIVARIAAAHAGTVELESEPGRGATFTLDLPLTPPQEEPCPAS